MTAALFKILNCQVNVYMIAKPELIRYSIIFTARCYASAVLEMGLCLSVCVCVCLSVTSQSSTKTAKHIGSHKQRHTIAQGL